MSHEQHFAQWLQEYEAERIPDDMNIWNAIESQIRPVRRTTVLPRVGWLVAILILIMTTAGVYALDKIINNQVGDEGMNTVANLQQDPMGMNMLGVTEFAVEVPFNNGITLNPNLTVSGEGIEMTLQKVVIAPSLTRLELCYVEPSHLDTSETQWQPVMSLSVDNVAVIESQLVGQLPNSYDAETGCYTYSLTFALDGYVGEWTLSIDRLVYQFTPSVAELQQAFDDAGLPFTAMEGGSYSMVSGDNLQKPAIDEEIAQLNQAAQAIFEQWQEKVEGAWTFTFSVTEA